MRLSEFDPVVTATAVLRCVLTFKVSGNRRDMLHGGRRVEVNRNGGGGTNLGILSPRVRSANQTHCPLIRSYSRVESLGMFHRVVGLGKYCLRREQLLPRLRWHGPLYPGQPCGQNVYVLSETLSFCHCISHFSLAIC